MPVRELPALSNVPCLTGRTQADLPDPKNIKSTFGKSDLECIHAALSDNAVNSISLNGESLPIAKAWLKRKGGGVKASPLAF